MAVASTTIRVNGRDADLSRGTVSDGRNAAVALRPQSLAILRLLVAKPGVLVSKDEIMSAVWPNIAVTDDSLVQCVTEIRKALGDDRHAVIKTVPKRGYVFESGAQEKDQSCREVMDCVCSCNRCCIGNCWGFTVVQSPATWIGSAPVDRGSAF